MTRLPPQANVGDPGVDSVWIHPQGGRIVVYEDGSMDVRNHAGRRKKTSATPEALRRGHGQWVKWTYPEESE